MAGERTVGLPGAAGKDGLARAFLREVRLSPLGGCASLNLETRGLPADAGLLVRSGDDWTWT